MKLGYHSAMQSLHNLRHKQKGLIVALVIFLVACGPRTPQATLPTSAPAAAPVVAGSPETTVGDFLNAWASDNYEAMYALLTPNSRDAFPLEDFEGRYRSVERTMTVLASGKRYTLTNAYRQGEFAEIAYDMTFDTRLFGSFTDAGRSIELVALPEGWRIAWSPATIFAEFKDGAALQANVVRPNRGNIYDRDGEVIADQNGRVIVVTLRTQEYPTNDPAACFQQLARVFPKRGDAERMMEIFGPATNRDFAYEIGEVAFETFRLERETLERYCTLEYADRPTRRYVAGGLAPHVVGYVGRIPAERADEWAFKGYPPDALIGIDGIERFWEDALSGEPEAQLNIVLNGVVLRTLAQRAGRPAQSVYLTLKRDFQETVQNDLRDAFENSVWGTYAPGGAAIVMDVNTGEILAIASYPTFDVDAFNPNTALPNADVLLQNYLSDPRKPTLNRATLGQYAPGSVFKIVTVAAAADSGEFTLNTRHYCSGIWNGQPLGDRLRKDWIANTPQRQHGSITLKQALTGSCNIYFWHSAWTLNGVDPNILPDHARRMGFGALTGLRDIAEAPGSLPDPNTYEQVTGRKWRGSDALNMAIGQGDVIVSPLQIVRMVAAVANGGKLYQPLLVKQVGLIGEPSYVAEPVQNGDMGFPDEIYAGIREAMCKVTTDPLYGTAYFVFEDWGGGAVICGKTGTAETGGLPHAWFAAFAGRRADEPEIAIVVMVERSNEGSFIAAPIVRRIVEHYFDLPVTPFPPWYQGGLPTFTGD
jgi:penicillin-binding protein 2